MRFIIHEQAYETPLAAGELRYARNGAPTGAVEAWRLTTAVSGYRFLRVDLDARAAKSGHSYLYHLTLNPEGRAEQLKFRFWGAGLTVTGVALLDADGVFVTRKVSGTDFEDEVTVPPGYGFWFPSSVGLGLLARGARATGAQTAVSLATRFDSPPDSFRAFATQVSSTLGTQTSLQVGGKKVPVRPFTLRWLDQERHLWLDADGWPFRMKRGDELTAVATRHIRYSRITQPGSP